MLQGHVAATKTCVVHTEATCSGDKITILGTRENIAGTCPRDMLQRHVPCYFPDLSIKRGCKTDKESSTITEFFWENWPLSRA